MKHSIKPLFRNLPLLAAFLSLHTNAQSQPAESSSALRWVDVRELGVEGRGWIDTKEFYDRLPAKAEKIVRPAVWGLSQNSAGMLVRFVTDATNIHARWALTSSNLAMPHMAATGVSGLDLYVRTPSGSWRWLAVGRPKGQTNSVPLATGLDPGEREYLLYLPLYNGTKFAQLGVSSNALLRRAGPWGRGIRKPIVFYGTSILQGACASRPGMVYSAILGRRFNCPTINLGFSGNGKMEPEVAALLAELDPAIYVIDCLPNMTADLVSERVEPLVRRLRQSHPATPIILLDDRTYADAFLNSKRREINAGNRMALEGAYQRLIKSGVKHLHHVEGENLLGNDGEGTVDGSHPNDAGFLRQAEALAKVLLPLLQ